MEQQKAGRTQEDDAFLKKKKSLDTLYEISQILGTNLNKRMLSICIELCEQGVPPENVAVSIYSLFISKKINI